MKFFSIIFLILLPLVTIAQGHQHIEGTGDICFCEPVAPPPVITDSTIFLAVQKAAEFPGGYQAMINFIKANQDTSKIYTEDSPKAYLKFLVEKDGRLTQMKPIKYCSCNAEAERIFKLMPYWVPGRQDGKIVRSQFVLKMEFKKK